jgi:hypothetical protein
MTVRKPAAESWESWVDRQIREAEERGEFDDLPGTGKPLPDLHRQDDELWWVRKKLKRENLSYLPPTLHVRKELERAREQIARADSEEEVRRILGGHQRADSRRQSDLSRGTTLNAHAARRRADDP